jgi:hypothetical protein
MNFMNCGRDSFLRNRTFPVIAGPRSWKTFFARSTPTFVYFISPSSPLHGSQTIILAHCDAVWGGRQPPRLTSLRLKLIKIGARIVHHAPAITFQLAEVAVTGAMVRAILAAIRRLRAPPLCA